MKLVFKWLDELLARCFRLNARYFTVNVEDEAAYYPKRQKMVSIDDILHDMEILDAKSSALLTHISLMFVVVGFFLVESGGQTLVQNLLIVEFFLYALTAMMVLRCVDIMGPPFRDIPDDSEELQQIYYCEVGLRRGVYQRCLRSTFFLTALLIPIISIKYALLR